MTAVAYEDVSMAYAPGRPVLAHVSLEVAKGEFLTIIGSSGSGKTTLLKMANGLIMPTEGEVLVGGRSTRTQDLTRLRRRIGYAIQGNVLFPHLTVEENIAYVPRLERRPKEKDIRAAVQKWMAMTGLEDGLRARYPRQLSGGQQQRVGIARALAASPDILLMDEPFGAVDDITRRALQDEIQRIQRKTGITVLFVTHDLEEAFKLGDRVAIMAHGRLQQHDTPNAILRQPASGFVKDLIGRLTRPACTPDALTTPPTQHP